MSTVSIQPFGPGVIYPKVIPTKEYLGGKGANLVEMASMGLPIPPGFVIPCEVSVKCNLEDPQGTWVLDLSQGIGASLFSSLEVGLSYLKEVCGYSPLVSVRSGARVSMPGMMDTILNVGLTSDTLDVWKGRIGPVATLDSYRRLIQMYSSVALGVNMELFEDALHRVISKAGVSSEKELDELHLEGLVNRYLKIVVDAGFTFPDTLMDQVIGATYAVFKSWNNPRAVEYRKIHNYPDDWGTAVTIQSMVFGNMNDNSATGVVFTRCPSTGKNEPVGEFLVNAQGEDVVAGIRTPLPLEQLSEALGAKVNRRLLNMLKKLEKHYRDAQDVEFTIQDGELWLLQTRNAKRSPRAAFHILHDLVEEGILAPYEVAGKVTSDQLFHVMKDVIDPAFTQEPHFSGIAAGGGVVTGEVVMSSDNAIKATAPCILVTKETNPDDIAGMNASVGILTATGGLTSHAAVVARGMHKTCVVGCTGLAVFGGSATFYKDGESIVSFKEGGKITIDGSTGNVWVNVDVPLASGGASPEVRKVVSWLKSNVYTDRLELYPTISKESMLAVIGSSLASVVHVDTVCLDGKSRYSDESDIASKIKVLGSAFMEYPHLKVVIDLSGENAHFSPGDDVLLKMFSVDENLLNMVITQKLGGLLRWPKSVRARTSVILPEGYDGKEAVEGGGMQVMEEIKHFGDLVNAKGPFFISSGALHTAFGSYEAYSTALTLAATVQGFTGFSIPLPEYWYAPILSKVT